MKINSKKNPYFQPMWTLFTMTSELLMLIFVHKNTNQVKKIKHNNAFKPLSAFCS